MRDLDANTTVLVNRATGEHGAARSRPPSRRPSRPNGRYVVFGSYADNMTDDDYDNPDNSIYRGEYGDDGDIFMRDIVANTTILISRETGANGFGRTAMLRHVCRPSAPASDHRRDRRSHAADASSPSCPAPTI